MAKLAVDVFVGNDTLIDPDVYQLWLNGYTIQDAASQQQKRGILQQYGATFDMVVSDIHDHYRTLGMLERYLKNPDKLESQLELQISPATQKWLIEKYYDFDLVIVREILGKKLTSRYRNSLDDISEKSRVPLKSCRRQFDNVKRVLKAVEEKEGSLVENIQSHFLLPINLAQQYAAIVFILNNRFDLSRKKLSYLTFGDFVYCANMMITHWSYSSKDCKNHEDNDVDIDRDFLQALRDLKTLSEKEFIDEYKQLISRALHGKKMSLVALADLESNFKNLSKTLINIAYGLNHSKELRDLFFDLLEKFIEPCRQAGWTVDDVRQFFVVYLESGNQLSFFTRSNLQLATIWGRYLTTVGSCVVQMYHT